MRALAITLVVVVALALVAVQLWLMRWHGLPQAPAPRPERARIPSKSLTNYVYDQIQEVPRPERGWLWEQPWHRQVAWWGAAVGLGVGAIVAGAVIANKVPPDSDWDVVVRGLLLVPAVVAGFVMGRRNRRQAVAAPKPMFQHGPAGWTWDGQSMTWRPPK